MLIGLGAIAAALLTFWTCDGSSPLPTAIFASATVVAMGAAVVTHYRASAGGTAAAIAAAIGLTESVTLAVGGGPGIALWWVPGLLLGFGAAYAFGARIERIRTSSVVLAIVGASSTALLALLSGLPATEAAHQGPLPTAATPLYLDAAALVALLAAGLMARWSRLGALLVILACGIGSAGIALDPWADSVRRWLVWMPSAILLLASATAALRQGWNAARRAESPKKEA